MELSKVEFKRGKLMVRGRVYIIDVYGQKHGKVHTLLLQVIGRFAWTFGGHELFPRAVDGESITMELFQKPRWRRKVWGNALQQKMS